MVELSPHLSDLALDEHIAGLETPRASAASAHLATCPACAARAETLRHDYAQFLTAHPRAEVERSAGESAGARAPAQALITIRPRLWWVPFGGALAAATAALLIAVLPAGESLDGDGLRSKGGTVVEIAVGRGDISMPFDGQPLRAGDRLAFRYSSTARHLMLVSLEASGRISVLLPAAGERSMSITPGQQVRLDEGVELDDYPGPERLWALFSSEPLSADAVRAAVDQSFATLPAEARSTLALPPLPLQAEQLSWLLAKEQL